MASCSQKRNNKKNKVKIEEVVDPVVISSDEEVYAPRSVPVSRPRINFAWDWKKEVTPPVANLTKKQTLHIPSWVVRAHLMKKRTVWLRSVDNGRTYNCFVFKPKDKGVAVRYIGDEWYDYLDDHKPRVGDALLFDNTSTEDLMLVKLLRAEDRRRGR